MKRIFLGLLGAVAFAIPAMAQVNAVPQVGLTTGYLPKATYSSAFFGLVPVTAGTDIICIAGSASKTVRVQQITVWGTTATAVQTLPLNLLRRATADTGGTPAATTANPGTTTQINRRDTSVAGTATATLISYTANPTINDAAPTYIDSQLLTMPIVTSVLPAAAADFNFARDIENNLAPPTLYGAAQQICVNANAATITNASTWNGSVVWTEE